MSVAAPSSFLLYLFLVAGGGVGFPLGVPPLPEDPALTKVAPQECLFYFSAAGMAKPDPKSTNQTEKLFAEPEVRRLAVEVERLVRRSLQEEGRRRPDGKVLAEDVPTLVKVLLTRPLAVYVGQVKVVQGGPPDVRAGVVVSLGEEADKAKAALERIVSTAAPGKAKEVTIDGTTFSQMPLGPGGPEVTWGVKGNYLYAATGEGELQALLKRADGAAPKWLPALHKRLPIERVSTVCMINVHALAEQFGPMGGPDVGRVLEALGVSSVGRLESVSGLDKDGYVTRSLLSLHGEPQGVFQLFEQKPLTTADLELIPRDATFAAIWKFDAPKAWTTILNIVEKIDPKTKEQITEREPAQVRELREEVFKALGDSWCVFDSPSAGGMFIGVTAVVSVKDPQAAAAVQKKLLEMVPAAGSGDPRRAPDGRPRIKHFTFGGKTVYVFETGEKNVPLAPSWCLTDKHLVIALYPEAVKAFLARGKTFQSLDKVAEVGATLEGQGQTVFLSYVDTRRLFDLFYPFLPVVSQVVANELGHEGIDLPPGLLPSAGSIRRHLRPSVSVLRRTPSGIETVSRQSLPGGLTPVALGLLLPAVQKVRQAAGRVQSQNNLKQIAIAMHNYHDVMGSLPPAYRADKDGKPLLSWRVLILPYIEQQNLYNQFHLDEPWDSPHNKKLIELMPKTYRSPAAHAPPGWTNYLTVRGKDTAFPGARGVTFAQITDGLSNTIMVVEASDRKAVPWTKPDDFAYSAKNPLDGLVGLWPAGFQAALCDGSVRFISAAIDPTVLKNLFLINDGNPLPPGY
jgi:hypothetical protein